MLDFCGRPTILVVDFVVVLIKEVTMLEDRLLLSVAEAEFFVAKTGQSAIVVGEDRGFTLTVIVTPSEEFEEFELD